MLKKVIKKYINKIFTYTSHQLGVKYVTYTSGFSSYFTNAKLSNTDYHKSVLTMDQGNQLIFDLINTNKPFLICRFGDLELATVCNHLHNNLVGERDWNDFIKERMFAGISGNRPPNDLDLDMFSKIYLKDFSMIDVLGVWNNRGEDFITRFLCPKAELIPLKTLEPFFFNQNPWSLSLEGKKVLVIHPYEGSIISQHRFLHKLFNNTFPFFDLVTYKPFNVITHDKNILFNWFDKLEEMKQDITKLSFDIALIAAGPFGFPLAAHIKIMGRQAIHVGGALQLFFGIKGKRWENSEHKEYFNDSWVYPSDEETPPLNVRLEVDNGDYWK